MESKPSKESLAVQTHITVLQNIITRMASNSSSCKNWCVTITVAVAVLVVEKGEYDAIVLGYIPLVVFLFLDAYYLSLERSFRKNYETFIENLSSGSLLYKDVYVIRRDKDLWDEIISVLGALKSFSIYPFYTILFIALFIGGRLIK